ncbi:beta-N-acetylglucosaminidase domain-containing protein [Streptomyces sp. NPDC008150]|uniref:beta-N-acetylhexosaminidase family protein n=1 Tax=Streptomyces sp. NPDC008150 TaxID=3364816 RepID=UPI0036DFE5BB
MSDGGNDHGRPRQSRSATRWSAGLVTALVVVLLARACTGGGGPAATGRPSDKNPDGGQTSAHRDAVPPGAPVLWPAPRSVRRGAGAVPVGTTVVLRAGAGTDRSTLAAVTAALRAGGATRVRTGTGAAHGQLLVAIGSDGSTPGPGALGTPSPAALPAGGYTLAVGTDHGEPRVVLAGRDADGAFHAAQTLAQLVRPVGSSRARTALPALRVRDWPATATRGIVEGFYGTPWTQADRLRQLDLAARYKLGTYLYSPKADPYLRGRWRDPYPATRLADLRALAARAAADHVSFVYALSPGPSVCYSSAADTAALTAKFRQLWDVGVRAFAVPLDDIDITRWNCARDAAVYGTGRAAVARAQADLLNRVQRGFLDARAGAAALVTVPTEYDGGRASAYKSALAARLDRRVRVMWTGPLVVAPTVSARDARTAARLYGHPVLLWDNYPVNDYTADHLLLGPYEGRDAGLPGAVSGITANPMNQAAASDPVLFSVAAYAWNPSAYRPAAALDAGLAAVADGDPRALAALRAFADVNRASRLDGTQAPGLAALIAAYRRGGADAEAALRARLTVLAGAPDAVPDAFARSAAPWLAAASDWARSALAALALRDGTGGRAAVTASRTAARAHTVVDWQGTTRTVSVGEGVLDAFVARALGERQG